MVSIADKYLFFTRWWLQATILIEFDETIILGMGAENGGVSFLRNASRDYLFTRATIPGKMTRAGGGGGDIPVTSPTN